jgi:hypothetical protein
MINIPNENRQWSQPNTSDLFGNLYTTKNINFDNVGYLQLSPSPRVIYSREADDGFRLVRTAYFHTSGYWVQTTLNPFVVNSIKDAPTKLALSGDVPAGALQSDALAWGGSLLATTSNRVKFNDGTISTAGDWKDTNVALTSTSGGQHPLANFVSRSAWAVANINTVRTYTDISATPTLEETLTIPSEYLITSMVYFNQFLYIGTRTRVGQTAAVFAWNGSGTAPQQVFEIDGTIVHDMAVFQGSIVVLSSSGALLRFNGAGFDVLATLPIYHTTSTTTDAQNVTMYRGSLKANSDVLYVNIGSMDNTFFLNQPSGVWCYEPRVGLYHKYSFSLSPAVRSTGITTSNVNTTTNTITTSASNVPMTGTLCVYNSEGSTPIGGLEEAGTYFVIKVANNQLKLAETKADAIAGNEINLTGTGNNSQAILYYPNIDYGTPFTISRSGAMGVVQTSSGQKDYVQDVLFSVFEMEKRDSGTAPYLLTPIRGAESRGYFITPKILSNNVTDKFNNLVIKHSALKNDIDKIIIKYRTEDDDKNEVSTNDSRLNITWTSSTTFTTTGGDGVEVGHEVEIITGAGGGLLAHVTDISLSGSTYTVTIDEEFEQYASGDTGRAIFRNWKKFLIISHDHQDTFHAEQLGVTGKFIQIKVELRGLEVRIEELKIDNKFLLPTSR